MTKEEPMPKFLPHLTIGCDPEIFLTKDGQPVSAYGLIKGTKWEPELVEHGGLQVDGTALEFNIHPANTVDNFTTNINSVLQSLRDRIPSDYVFDYSSSRMYDRGYFASLPDQAKELGCQPDWNAWTMEMNPPPDASSTLRTIAGHIHVGWLKEPAEEEEHFYDCIEFVKQLDYCLGIPSVVLDNSPNSNARRKLYGKAGSFRSNPNYGLEYRVLSPFWLASEERMRWVFGAAQHAYDLMQRGIIYQQDYGSLAQEIIDYGLERDARRFVKDQNWELPK